MNFRHFLMLMLPVIFFFTQCEKEADYTEPVIGIISPALHSDFIVPGKMYVELRVESGRKINFIRAGIVNQDLAPVFGNRFFYPDSTVADIAFEIDMDALPPGSGQQHYLHIAVDDGIKLTHRYHPVMLSNTPLKYQGLFMITAAGYTRISFYDEQYTEVNSLVLDGGFGDAEISPDGQMLFISTAIPAKLFAFDTETLNSRWSREPEMPYPYYTDLYADGNYLFVGYGNERIDALDAGTGTLKTGTAILVDSVPQKIGVSEQYFAGWFEKRTAPARAWVSFYRATGATYNKLSTSISVVDFYRSGSEDVLLVMGNNGNNGVYSHYNIHENSMTGPVIIHSERIDQTCAINEELYVFSSNSKIYSLNLQSENTTFVLQTAETVVNLQYNQIEKQLLVATELSLEVYAWPGMEKIKTVNPDAPLKAIRLRYGY